MAAKARKDDSHNKSTASANFLPSFVLQPALVILSYINSSLGFAIPPMGIKKDNMGHYILTNVGTLGMMSGMAPLCPPMHAMGLTCAGKIAKKAVVIDEQIVIQDVIRCTQTVDHRFGDGATWKPCFNVFKAYMENPKEIDFDNFEEVAHWSEKKTE